MRIAKIIKFLSCPECGNALNDKKSKVACNFCRRKYYCQDNFVDLLPAEPKHLQDVFSAKAYQYYKSQFSVNPKKKFKKFDVWGRYDKATRGYRVFLRAESESIKSHFPKKRTVLCDISAASGFYTLRFAKNFDFVFHCDINLEYLRYAQKKAKKRNVKNIFFIRADYFRLPFRNKAIDLAICIDSLEYYGRENDLQIIKGVYQKLAKKGVFAFDLHYRKFYAPDRNIFEYRQQDLVYLRSYFPDSVFIGLGRAPTNLMFTNAVFRFFSKFKFFPPTRYLGVLKKI